MLHPISPRLWSFVLVATLGLVGPAAAADWTVKPAANHFGADREQYAYTVNPGGQLEDDLVVVNDGAAPLRLTVYAADAFNRAGKLALRGQDATPSGVGAWVHPEQAEVTVPSGGSAELPFAISLPKEAAPGDYVGGIVTAAGDERVDIPVRVRVGGALKPSLAVEDVQVRDSTVTYTIRNTGNAILSAHQSASVSGPFGRWAVDADKLADSPPLLPGGTWKTSAPVQDVKPALRLTATVTLIPLLTDAAGSTAPLAPVKASGHAWAIPWSVVSVFVVLCALALVGLTRRRRRQAHAVA